jgi:hypothetical protein
MVSAVAATKEMPNASIRCRSGEETKKHAEMPLFSAVDPVCTQSQSIRVDQLPQTRVVRMYMCFENGSEITNYLLITKGQHGLAC